MGEQDSSAGGSGGSTWRAKARFLLGGALPVFVTAGLAAALLRVLINGYPGMGMHLLALVTARRILMEFLLALGAGALMAVGAGALARSLSRRRAVGDAAFLVVLISSLAAALLVEFRPSPFWSTRAWEVLKAVQGALGPLGALIGRREFRLAVLAAAALVAAAVTFLALLKLLSGRAGGATGAGPPGLARALAAERLAGPARGAAAASLALAAGIAGGAWIADVMAHPGGPSVLLITIDTLRADHLEAYGHPRETAPHLSALARRGVRFTRAVAQAPWTLPSIASLQTGRYPREHGAIYPDLRVGEGHTLLGEHLRNAGYATAVVSSWLFVSTAHGFAQGVDTFDRIRVPEDQPEMPAPEITRRAIRHLRRFGDRPFYLWLHYVEPHTPYLDHGELDYASGYRGPLEHPVDVTGLYRLRRDLREEDLAHARDLYDEEITFMDARIGEVLRELDRLGLSERTLVVVAGDHGEEFHERGGFGHHHQVHQEVIRVPLIIAGPAVEAGPILPGAGAASARAGGPAAEAAVVVDHEVEIRHVARTILDRCGVHAPEVPGIDLLALAEDPRAAGAGPRGTAGASRGTGGADPAERLAFSEHHDRWKRIEAQVAVLGGGWKMIRDVTSGASRLYHLDRDPLEREDLSASGDPRARRMAERLAAGLEAFRRRGASGGVPAPLSAEERERMRTLGYVD